MRYLSTLRTALAAALVAIIVAMAAPLFAAVTATPVFVQTPKFGRITITLGNTTTAQTLYTCGSNGSKIVSVTGTSTDTTARDVQLALVATTNYVLVTANLPVGAGTSSSSPTVNFLSPTIWPGLPIDSDGNPYFFCQSGDVIAAQAVVTITAAKTINIMAVAADF